MQVPAEILRNISLYNMMFDIAEPEATSDNLCMEFLFDMGLGTACNEEL
jgi:hypothetical protein